MDCVLERTGIKQEVASPFCPKCGNVGWRDGWRFIKRQAKLGEDEALEWVVGFWRARCRCPNPDCDCRSWTVYEIQGDPHRTYSPAVAAAAVAELLACDTATVADVARRWGCSRWTLVRWLQWIAGLVELGLLLQLCWRHDPSGLPPPTYKARKHPDPPEAPDRTTWKSSIVLVGSLILLFERLARLYRDRLLSVESGPGLSAILRDQFDRFRLVAQLTRSSPPLQAHGLWPDG